MALSETRLDLALCSPVRLTWVPPIAPWNYRQLPLYGPVSPYFSPNKAMAPSSPGLFQRGFVPETGKS